MKEETMHTRVCPICGRTYTDVPALSRKDSKTLICPDCGAREAMTSIGISEDEQKKILKVMHGGVNG